MNILDLLIIFILALFLVAGMYKGFIASCYRVVSYVITFIVTLVIYPLFAKIIFTSDKLVKSFRFYAEGSEKLANIESASLKVADLSSEQISTLVRESVAKVKNGLRVPMDRAVVKNMSKQNFQQYTTVGEYINETIVHVAVNMIAFLILFFLIKMFFNIVLNVYESSTPFPVLRQYDVLFGGLVSLLEGVMMLFIVFSIVPLLMNVMTVKPLEDMLSSSLLGNFFVKSNFIPYLIRSRV